MPDSFEEVDEFLAHFGVKGMRWGVRKDRTTASEDNTGSSHKKLKVAGAVLGVAVIAAGAVYVAKHGGVSASSLSSSNGEKAKSFVEDLVKEKEPTSIILTSDDRGFIRKGGLSDPIHEYEKAGFNTRIGTNEHRRYGSSNEKVAVAFRDPRGLKDASGRPVLHQVILPKAHASGITDFESAKSKAWSLAQGPYDEYVKAGKPSL